MGGIWTLSESLARPHRFPGVQGPRVAPRLDAEDEGLVPGLAGLRPVSPTTVAAWHRGRWSRRIRGAHWPPTNPFHLTWRVCVPLPPFNEGQHWTHREI